VANAACSLIRAIGPALAPKDTGTRSPLIPSKFIEGKVYGLMFVDMKDPRNMRVPTKEQIEELAITYRLTEMEEGPDPAKRRANPRDSGSPSG
jgi:hypothetical protein